MNAQTSNNTTTNSTNSNRNFVKATSLTVGQSLTGTVKALENSTKYEGKVDILMEGADGALFVLFIAGNLKDAIADGTITANKKITITRQADKVVNGKKGQYTVSQFAISEAKSLFGKNNKI